MAKRLQQVDFLQFVCTHLSEEVAKHIRIYRKSLKTMATKNSEDVDFEDIFFQLEQDLDRLSTSHANVCLDENYEKSKAKKSIIYISNLPLIKCRHVKHTDCSLFFYGSQLPKLINYCKFIMYTIFIDNFV